MFRENPDLSSDIDIYDEERRSNTKSRHIFIGNLSHLTCATAMVSKCKDWSCGPNDTPGNSYVIRLDIGIERSQKGCQILMHISVQ